MQICNYYGKINIGEVMKKIKANWLYIITFILGIIFIYILSNILLDRKINIDYFMYDEIVLNYRFEYLTNIFKVITLLASPIFILGISILVLVLLNGKKDKFNFGFNILFVTILNQIIKHLIARPRPEVLHLVTENGFSFPSGHAMAAVAFYGYFIYMLWQLKLSKRIKYLGTVGLILLIILICLSRIYLGVHYPSDIIAGICLSLIYLIIYIRILKKKEN